MTRKLDAATDGFCADGNPIVAVAERAVRQVREWLDSAVQAETREEKRAVEKLGGVVTDPEGMAFAMGFVDRVMRPENHRTAARQLVDLVKGRSLPGFLSALDKAMLRAGALVAPVAPGIVMPLAARRMRKLVGPLVVDSEPDAMSDHLDQRRNEGFRLNVNLLGEAVLGRAEADRRHVEALALLDHPGVDYVSVKVSAIVAQLNDWDWNGSMHRVAGRLRPLFAKAAKTSPPTFINLDMEEYHDLELTMSVFMTLLEEPALHGLDAGIVLQAYLPDSFPALQRLSQWASQRRRRKVNGHAGGTIKIRLVKGANLAMERVEATLHGWPQAPYHTKAETDANYKRCLDWAMTRENLAGTRLGIASHNLFDVAFAYQLAQARGVTDNIEFEMLQGMASSQARVVREETGSLLLYTPVVAETSFDVAISYLFRRLEENAADENFIHHLFDRNSSSEAFELEANKFRLAIAQRNSVGAGPQRQQNRSREIVNQEPVDKGPSAIGQATCYFFRNEPDTDPALPANREWAVNVMTAPRVDVARPMVDDLEVVRQTLTAGQNAQQIWAEKSLAHRREILHRVADELSRRRGDLIAAMVHEANKTFAEADPEVSEAIDFARYYGDKALLLDNSSRARFEPLGVVAVVPPWNFPVAIPAGGVTAALAAGNAVIFKPAPETPRCAEIVAECCWAAGVPEPALQYLRVPDNDTGRKLVTGADAVLLTGAFETANLFRSWRPDMRLFAETSGKNALVISPNADIDLAVANLVASAFGHCGQKCSAASLAICIGDVYESPRLRRQLIDAVTSLQVGPTTDLGTHMGPTISEPRGKLLRGLTELDSGEEWLVQPQRLGPATWSPGIRIGVRRDSWFHRNECFGPVLGLMAAADLKEAIELQNASAYGLTGGLHSLDDNEIATWLEGVEVGNAYVNRPTTGAIVQRQPFGGWKRSSIGPGNKAGGPNYVARLGTWQPTDSPHDKGWLDAARASDKEAWLSEFSVAHDPSALFCEENTFRYRPLHRIAIRVTVNAESDREPQLTRVLAAAEQCGVESVVSLAANENAEMFARRLAELGVERVRVIGAVEPELRAAALTAEIHIADDPVTAEGRVELLHYLKEQSISRTLHRYGNLIATHSGESCPSAKTRFVDCDTVPS